MSAKITVALDAMGGDYGPEIAISGADKILAKYSDVEFIVYGDSKLLEPIIEKTTHFKNHSQLEHTDVAIAMDEKPSQALRHGRKVSSMWQTIDAVNKKNAQVAVSAGNTGALMAMSKVILKTMSWVERPAIAAVWPTLNGKSIVLDVGATIGADAEQLVSFAVMGEAMARCILGIEKPSVGLLNIGVEEMKGADQVRIAGRLLRDADLPMEYYGFVEGNDLGKGTVDVVVTEGFSGNIALKTAEGTAKQISQYLKNEMHKNFLAKLGGFLASGAFKSLKAKLDPRLMNGGVFLGLNGIVVKSHGGTDALGFSCAIDLAIKMTKKDLINKIANDLELYNKTAVSYEAIIDKI